MVVAQVGVAVQVEGLSGSQCSVEVQEGSCIPVSVNVHGSGVSSAGFGVVDGCAADAVFVLVERCVHSPSHLLVNDVVVVEDVEAVRPAASESAVTGADVQGVAAVHYLKELCHCGLRHASVEADA